MTLRPRRLTGAAVDIEKYTDECVKHLFRLKLPAYIEPLKQLFMHYDGLEDYLEYEAVPQVELAVVLKHQKTLNYIELTHILKELYVANIRVCSNKFHHSWNPYESPFKDFLEKHLYVRVWDDDTPSHLPDTVLVTYCD